MNSYVAKCPCGYVRYVTTGGLRENFLVEAYFPFCCESCGVVSVNVKSEKKSCPWPWCNSLNIKEYGTATMSLPNNDTSYVYCFEHQAPIIGNFCPKCEEMTLRFEPDGLIID
jgi:hypothetical protein